MIAIETTFFNLAETCNKNCLVICDRGIMDPTACMFLKLSFLLKIKMSFIFLI